jgi:glycosyltransferase involved in cell wall biosynthesis
MTHSLKIGILGTRGIPNRYGGFEECAENLALRLVEKGHKVWVYNSHSHEYQLPEWKGVRIIHCKDPEDKLGTFGQFIYDLNCTNDARKRDFDILLQLGYTSNSIWYYRWPKQSRNIVNMDGLEWKRSKYNKYVQKFLKYAERLAAMHGDVLIADSKGIQQYLETTYHKASHCIAYGASIFSSPNEAIPAKYSLLPYNYYMLIARMEPENNIEMIIKGYMRSGSEKPLCIVGNTSNAFGAYLTNKYDKGPGVHFAGGIYDKDVINNLRYYCSLYFHGHSVGGTNPSLLEAMACNALIAAHDNVFNKSILGDDAFYFSDEGKIAELIKTLKSKKDYGLMTAHNIEKIHSSYNWNKITDAYEQVFIKSVN